MNADSILTDVRYAIKQLRLVAALEDEAGGAIRRAMDSLERVEEELTADLRDGSGVHDDDRQAESEQCPT